MNAITSHECSDVLRWMSPSSWPPGGSRALGRARPNQSWSTSKRFRPRATDHGNGTRCEYRSLAVRRGGCEPASSTTLIDAAARFELQGGPRIAPIDPIGHARMSVPGIGDAVEAGRVERGERQGLLCELARRRPSAPDRRRTSMGLHRIGSRGADGARSRGEARPGSSARATLALAFPPQTRDHQARCRASRHEPDGNGSARRPTSDDLAGTLDRLGVVDALALGADPDHRG
jgi:hypothetical protein